MIQGMPGRKNVGRTWVIIGNVYKHGKRVRHVKKTVMSSCEGDLEIAERDLRTKLYEQAVRAYGEDVKDLKIEVSSELE